jgi:hypothetical protein
MALRLLDHHDSKIINRGLTADAGYRGTFPHEAEQDLEELRTTFRRKAHTSVMERCLTTLLRAEPHRTVGSLAPGDDGRTARRPAHRGVATAPVRDRPARCTGRPGHG